MIEAEAKDRTQKQSRQARIGRMISPHSIALVGASNESARIGGTLFANLKRAFKGPLYPVHPSDPDIMGVRAYTSLRQIGEPVDLAVIAVPAGLVPGIVEEAVASGAGGAVIVTAGLSLCRTKSSKFRALVAYLFSVPTASAS